jgi:hypothetical protein
MVKKEFNYEWTILNGQLPLKIPKTLQKDNLFSYALTIEHWQLNIDH